MEKKKGSVEEARYVSEQTSTPVDAKHVVHISLSEDIEKRYAG